MRILMLGAGGHARSVADALQDLAIDGVVLRSIDELTDAAISAHALTEADLLEFDVEAVELVNGVGQVGAFGARNDAYRRWRTRGYRFQTVVHQTATVSRSATLGHGVQILAGATVGPHVVLGENTLVNTGAIIEHDCIIGAGVHVASGAILCGGVRVGNGSMVGAGATVIQGRKIGDAAQVGAGAVVIADVGDREMHVGVPARALRRSTGSNHSSG